METRILTNDNITRKRWAKDLFAVLLPAVEFDSLIGTGSDSIVQMRTELGKGEGDQITFGIRLPLVGDGVVGRDKIEGNEESLRFRDFKTTVEEARGDIYVAKNDIENAKKAYQSAWNNLVETKQERQILQIKLESVGVLVDDLEVDRPIIEVEVDESQTNRPVAVTQTDAS